jgi:hypothetical protein
MGRLRWIDYLVFAFIGLVIFFIMSSIFGWVTNNGIELFTVDSPLIFPFLVGAAMFVSLVATIALDLLRYRNVQKDEEKSKELFNDLKMVMIYVLGVLAYCLTIEKIGFVVGTVIFLIIGMVFMNYDEMTVVKKIRNAAIVSCIAVPVLYFIFYKVFNVMLP